MDYCCGYTYVACRFGGTPYPRFNPKTALTRLLSGVVVAAAELLRSVAAA